MTSLVVRILTYALIYCAIVLWQDSRPPQKQLLELNEASIDYRSYQALGMGSRNLLIFPDTPKEGININLNIDVLRFCFWDNEIQSLTTGAQFKSIGLESRIGMRVTSWLEFGLWHRSQHVLDGVGSFDFNYPTEDSLQFKIYLYRKPNREPAFK